MKCYVSICIALCLTTHIAVRFLYLCACFNAPKTKVLTISSNVSHHPPLQLSNHLLSEVDFHKHLGLIFHRSLSWLKHVVSLYHKAIA